MVVPESQSYPGDKKYQRNWTAGKVTQKGQSLMTMVGRSLRTRYGDFLKGAEWENIKVSFMNKAHIKTLAGELGTRLLKHTKHKSKLNPDLSWLDSNQNYDQMEKMFPPSNECNWMNSLMSKFKTDQHAGQSRFNRCTDGLYQILQEFIVVKTASEEEWRINSPDRVYKLWNLLVFQILEGLEEPKWATQNWTWIQSCVFENYRSFLTYHPAIPAMVSGRLIHQIKREEESDIKFHVHITNDIAVLNMNWTLPNSVLSHWPEPGDALLYDFYEDKTVEVSSFSAWQQNYDKIFQSDKDEFFKEYQRRRISLTEQEWTQLCYYNGKDSLQSVDQMLISDPLNLETSPTLKEHVKEFRYRQKGR